LAVFLKVLHVFTHAEYAVCRLSANEPPLILKEVSLAKRIPMFFQHDGVPAHIAVW
jgi:hypothetical protein